MNASPIAAAPVPPVPAAAAPAATPWPMPPTLDQVHFEVPESAKVDPHQTHLVNDIPKEGGAMEAWHELDSGSIPDGFRDKLYKGVITHVNDVLFRSRPGSPPQPERPDHPGAWHFSALGDYGNGTKAMTDVIANLERWKPELVLSVGDQVYPDATEKNWVEKIDPMDKFGGLGSTVPFIPNMGNHDQEPNPSEYFRRFPYVEGGRYFKASHKNLDSFSLDTNQSLAPGSPQYTWLAGALAASDAPWKIIQIHHPMMSVLSKFHYKETSRLPGDLGPLLAKYGVDLVLAGHEHWYERSRPLNEEGTLQLTVGGGGGALYPFFYPQTKWSQTRDLDFGHVDFEVRGDDELVGRYMTRDGKVKDTFVVPNRTPGGWKAGDALVGGAADVALERPPTEPAPEAAPAG